MVLENKNKKNLNDCLQLVGKREWKKLVRFKFPGVIATRKGAVVNHSNKRDLQKKHSTL